MPSVRLKCCMLWSCPLITSAAWSRTAFHSGSTSAWSPWRPAFRKGRCQNAIRQVPALAHLRPWPSAPAACPPRARSSELRLRNSQPAGLEAVPVAVLRQPRVRLLPVGVVALLVAGPVVVARRGGGDAVEAPVDGAVVAVELLGRALVVHVAEVEHAGPAASARSRPRPAARASPPSAPSPTAQTVAERLESESGRRLARLRLGGCRRRPAELRSRDARRVPPPTPTTSSTRIRRRVIGARMVASRQAAGAARRSARGLQARACGSSSTCAARCATGRLRADRVAARRRASPARTWSSRTSRAAPPARSSSRTSSLSTRSMPWDSPQIDDRQDQQASRERPRAEPLQRHPPGDAAGDHDRDQRGLAPDVDPVLDRLVQRGHLVDAEEARTLLRARATTADRAGSGTARRALSRASAPAPSRRNPENVAGNVCSLFRSKTRRSPPPG